MDNNIVFISFFYCLLKKIWFIYLALNCTHENKKLEAFYIKIILSQVSLHLFLLCDLEILVNEAKFIIKEDIAYIKIQR
jgi:hypothetical protein